ncbi:MAG: type II toxin-antitoxin system HicB family antitoxin [Chloroflexota bacterium]|nr:MAG: type II toxin-antitoxin system HicB family antitoxin [Chloroflexota bacterium]
MDRFNAVFEQVGDWWIGFVEELPGANAQGRSLDDVRENLREAVQLILEANRELARRESTGKTVLREELVVPSA